MSNKVFQRIASVDALSYFSIFTSIQGLDMPENYKYTYLLYSILWNTSVNFYMPFGFIMGFFTIPDAELQIGNLLTSLQVNFDVCGGSLKLIYLIFFIRKLRSAHAILDILDKRCRDADEINEIENANTFGRGCILAFAFAYVSYTITTCLGSVIMGHPPYSLYFPHINWRRSSLEFFAASTMETFLMFQGCVQQIVNDSYAVIYVRILRAHMKILLLRIQKLCTDRTLSLEQNNQALKLCVKDHQNILELYNIISPIISVTMFIQLMITATILGTTLINLTIFAPDLTSRIGSCFFILAVVTQSFPICYQAQCLMDESSRLAEVILHSHWVDQDMSYRKMLIFYMQRTQILMKLTAGKIIPINLNSFLSIAKFSFSLYTFIKEMNIKEKFDLT